jgi:Spy/CpxP family protein refolding chaperone
MNKRILIFIFAASIALNIAFAITWVGYGLSEGPADARMQFSQHDVKGQIWCPLHRSLDVTEEQWKQIEPSLLEFRKTSDGICQEVNNKRAEMINLLSVDEPNRQAITDKQKEILAGQEKMQQLVIEHLLFEKSVLTSLQQKDFFRFFRQRCGCAGNRGVSGKNSFREILNGDFESPQADKTNEQENK